MLGIKIFLIVWFLSIVRLIHLKQQFPFPASQSALAVQHILSVASCFASRFASVVP